MIDRLCSQHDSLLDTCAKTIRLDAETRPLADESSSAVSSSPTHTPVVLVFYTHHRPHLAHRDLDFFAKARQRGWICEEFYTEKPGVRIRSNLVKTLTLVSDFTFTSR